MTVETQGLGLPPTVLGEQLDEAPSIYKVLETFQSAFDVARAQRLGDKNFDGEVDTGEIAASWSEGKNLQAMPQELQEKLDIKETVA